MKITNKLNLPAGFVKACTTEQHNKNGEPYAAYWVREMNKMRMINGRNK